MLARAPWESPRGPCSHSAIYNIDESLGNKDVNNTSGISNAPGTQQLVIRFGGLMNWKGKLANYSFPFEDVSFGFKPQRFTV